MEALDRAIAKHQELIIERDSPEFWADNIIDASKFLESDNDWTIFYAYLGDKDNYDKTKTYVTMNDVECDPIPPCHPLLEEIMYKNGPAETIIHVKRLPDPVEDEQDDEKVE